VSSRGVYAALLAYVVGFALFPPRVFLVVDEERYVSQAVAFAHASRAVIFDTPPGTSLLQTPFVAIGGWRAAGLASVLALIVATLVTMRWLRDNDRNPGFALVIPGFVGTLFFARIGMSDVPASAVVALALWRLFRAEREDWRGSLLAGLAAGAVVLFREPPLLLVAPVALGAIVRRRCVPWAVVAGVVLGVSLRLVAYQELVGSAFYVRDSLYGFSIVSAMHGFPQYAGILLIMLPGGALLPFFYRGPRRLELCAGIAAYFGLFVFYEYDAIRENGLVKGLVLASRYMIPTLPILAFMAADVVPRAVERLFPAAVRAPTALGRVATALVVIGAFVIHPLVRRQEIVPLELVRAIYDHTEPGVPVLTNTRATLKYLSPSYGPRTIIQSYGVRGDSIAALARRTGTLDLVLIDRSDGEMFKRDGPDNARLVADAQARCTVQRTDDRERGWARLRVIRLTGCS
jgi:hypothetical protein